MISDEMLSAICQLCQFRGNVFDMSSHMTESHAATIRCCLCDEPIIDEEDVRCHRDDHLAARTLSGSAVETLPGLIWFLYIFIYSLVMHICVVRRIGLDFRTMRYIKSRYCYYCY